MGIRRTKKPGLSRPAVKDPGLQGFLEAVSERIQVIDGERGDPLDRAVTWRDLGGVGTVSGELISGVIPGTSVPPTGGGDGEEPLPPVGIPLNLTATPVWDSVLLEWDSSDARNYAYTEIWRHSSDNLGAAILVGTSVPDIWSDPVGWDITVYYWVRFVGEDGSIGPWNSASGTQAVVPPAIEDILNELEGQITESHLYSVLNTRIDLIDTPVTGLVPRLGLVEGYIGDFEGRIEVLESSGGSLDNAAITWEFNTDSDAEGWTAANGSLAGPTGGVLEFTASTTNPYIAGPSSMSDVSGSLNPYVIARVRRTSAGSGTWEGRVYYETSGHGRSGSYYKQIDDPGLTEDVWEVLTWDMGALTVGGTDWTDNLITRIWIDFDSTSGSVYEIDWIGIAQFSNQAFASALVILGNRVTDNEGDISALQVSYTALEADVSAHDGVLSGHASAISDLQADAIIQDDDISANASSITSLNTTVGNLNTTVGGHTTSINSLTSTVDYHDGVIVAQGSDITAIESAIYDNETGLNANAVAISALTTYVNNDVNDDILANASAITQLQAEFAPGGDVAVLQQQMTVQISDTGDLLGLYALRMNLGDPNNPYITGFGLSSEIIDGTATSSFIVAADTFAITLPSAPATKKFPFTVGLVNGVNTVGINGQLVVDGSIRANQIDADAVNANHINVNTLSAISANMGTLTAGLIQVGNLPNGYRVEISGSSTYPLWYGTGSKSAANAKFYVDRYGNAVFKGSLSAASGTFAGSLSAATGTFSGSLTANAVNAVSTLNLQGQSITITEVAYLASYYLSAQGTTNGWKLGVLSDSIYVPHADGNTVILMQFCYSSCTAGLFPFYHPPSLGGARVRIRHVYGGVTRYLGGSWSTTSPVEVGFPTPGATLTLPADCYNKSGTHTFYVDLKTDSAQIIDGGDNTSQAAWNAGWLYGLSMVLTCAQR